MQTHHSSEQRITPFKQAVEGHECLPEDADQWNAVVVLHGKKSPAELRALALQGILVSPEEATRLMMRQQRLNFYKLSV